MKSILIFSLTWIGLIILILINFFSTYIYENYLQGFPLLTIPILSIVLALAFSFKFCSWAVENDRLRYEFITIVTHKFRTPITGLRWAIDALSHDVSGQEKADLLKKMQTTNDRLMEIVDLLVGSVKFNKKFDYAYEAASLREMIDVSLQKYSEHIRRKDIVFSINSDGQIPLIIIDKRKIQFVIDMLVDNAIKYTPKNGSIFISLQKDKNAVTLCVRDTGIGIKPSDRKYIFKRFFRTSSARRVDTEGMGLGLFTVKTIIEKHGGKIWVESPGENKGSSFYVRLKFK